MGELICLESWKQKKDNEELDMLAALVKDLMKDVDITPQPYYPTPSTYHDGDLGMCIDSLLWCSDVLLEMGHNEYSGTVDNLIVKLTTENNRSKE